MSTYTKVEKEISTYTKTDKVDKGWFRQGWFTGWFSGEIYHKIAKVLSTYSKVDK